MKGVKLIEVNTDNACEEITGTCEFCLGSMWCDNPEITLEFPDGTQSTFPAYYWDWGDYHELDIDNYLNFSAWLQEQDFNKELYDQDDFAYIDLLLNEYYEEKEVNEENDNDETTDER